MYGAIFGDIIGSRFEFDRGGKTKDFELFTPRCEFTDDTVMTIAVGEALLNAGPDATTEEIEEAVTDSMQIWGHRYPNAGYGGRFYNWLFGDREPKPYGSYGNGSAMRVAAAGWLYDSLERTREVARATAVVTHNHPEGIKGAECTAAVMFLCRAGVAKDEIKKYVIDEFGYDLSESLDELRLRHEHVESCQDSLPKALVSFFEGENYEDVIRNAVSLGGDTDTLAAIAGAMAEAMYQVPVGIYMEGMKYLEEDIYDVLVRFRNACSGEEEREDPYAGNEDIKEALTALVAGEDDITRTKLVLAIVNRIKEDGEVPMPMIDKNNVLAGIDPSDIPMGGEFQLSQELRLVMDTMKAPDGSIWLPIFTSNEECSKGRTANIIINMSLRTILEEAKRRDDLEGVVLNAFSDCVTLTKEIVELILGKIEE